MVLDSVRVENAEAQKDQKECPTRRTHRDEYRKISRLAERVAASKGQGLILRILGHRRGSKNIPIEAVVKQKTALKRKRGRKEGKRAKSEKPICEASESGSLLLGR